MNITPHLEAEKENRTRNRWIGFLVAPLLMVVMAQPALAEERTCRGSIGRETVDNLRVPNGATCKLNDARVEGTIKVESNATLQVSKVIVIGNLQAVKNRGGLSINQNTIDGNLQCKENNPPPTGCGNIVKGSKEDQCARGCKPL